MPATYVLRQVCFYRCSCVDVLILFIINKPRGALPLGQFLRGGSKEDRWVRVGGGLWSRKRINASWGLRIYREEINPPQANKITH
jgi:hypothetical protein